MDTAVKARVASFRLRKGRQTELAALAAVHGRAAGQLAAAGCNHAAAVTAALEVSSIAEQLRCSIS